MPIIWIGFDTDSSHEVHSRRDKPEELKDFIAGIVRKTKKRARLEELYFEVGAPRACALIVGLDDYIDVKAITRILGADYATKLLNTQQAARAAARERALLKPPPKRRAPPRQPPKT
jgi:hypothetical protein